MKKEDIMMLTYPADTADGRNPANQLSLAVYNTCYRILCLYILGGAGFFPSTVLLIDD